MIIDSAVAQSPTSRETRAPQMTSASTLRPESSVPRGKDSDGPSKIPPVALVTSSSDLGKSSGARRASSTKTIRTIRPSMPPRSLRNSAQRRDHSRLAARPGDLAPRRGRAHRASASSARSRAHPGVEACVEEVGDEVREDDADGEEQEERLQERDVRPLERGDREGAEAGDAEDVLDGDGPTDDETEVEEDQRGRREAWRWVPRAGAARRRRASPWPGPSSGSPAASRR